MSSLAADSSATQTDDIIASVDESAVAEGGPLRHRRRGLTEPGREWGTAFTWPWIVGIAVLIVPVATFLARSRLAPITRATVWAEDGADLLGQHIEFGAWGSLFQVYGGYLQFVPRLITNAAIALAPLDRYATTVSALVCLTTGVVAALVFVCSRDVLSSVPGRLVLASITVLAPLLTAEVLGNMANIHWLLLWLTPWVMMYRPSRWWQSGVLAAVILAAALSEIQMALFIPLIFFSLRRRKSWPISAALVVGIVAQIVATSITPRNPNGVAHIGAMDIVKGYAQQVFLGGAFPSKAGLDQAFVSYGWKGAFAAGIPFLIVAIVIAFRFRGWRYFAPAVVVASATIPWAAAVAVNKQPSFLWNSLTQQQLETAGLLRYAVLPSMFLLALVVILADDLIGSRRLVVSTGGLVLLGVVLVFQSIHFPAVDIRSSEGPVWSESVAVARQQCETGATIARIATAPNPSWAVHVPCSMVLANSAVGGGPSEGR